MQKALRRTCIVLLLLWTSGLHAVNVEETLHSLSYEERFFLNYWFSSSFKKDCLGHVLFFETKPACLSAIGKNCHPKFYRDKLLYQGWMCWKKVESQFPHPHFLFLEEERYFRDESIIHVFVINKKSLLTTLCAHEKIFKERLGEDFSPELFLEKIEQQGQLRPCIHEDEVLLGIILGYGEESARAFEQDSLRALPSWTETYTGISVSFPQKCRLNPIEFVGNPQSPEVLELLERYSEEMNILWNMYKTSRSSLTLVLKQLCE